MEGEYFVMVPVRIVRESGGREYSAAVPIQNGQGLFVAGSWASPDEAVERLQERVTNAFRCWVQQS